MQDRRSEAGEETKKDYEQLRRTRKMASKSFPFQQPKKEENSTSFRCQTSYWCQTNATVGSQKHCKTPMQTSGL
ncbi:hypothetical protein J6590_102709, partial [Homalodisca vitripennis]